MTAQLHPQYETMFLLCSTPWDKEQRDTLIAELNKMGFEGEALYQKNYQVVEQYYRAFARNCIQSRGTELLRNMDDGSLTVCTGVFGLHPDWFDIMGSVSEQDASDAVKEVLLDDSADETTVISALEEEEISDESKWKIMLLHKHAKQQLTDIAAAVKENIPAYEKARGKVEKKLKILMKQFEENINNPEKNRIFTLPEKFIPDGEIVPTLAFPMSVIVNTSTCFYGLMSNEIWMGQNAEFTPKELLVGAKALSDKSKIETLIGLKEKPMYNYEIAEQVGLTPATVSHHMNTLLAAGFVELGKAEGKGCYTLNAEGIERYLKGVRRILLTEQ
ncbi:MAG: ArsR/SmtB family transcription factor [Lachnospiraceae bacterium]